MTFCQFISGTFGNVAAGTHLASDRLDAPVPADARPPKRDITGEAVSKLDKAPRPLRSEPARAFHLHGGYDVISIESEDANMSIRGKSILTTLAIALIGTTPAWSQSLLKTLDPDHDGTVDLAEAKNAASKAFDKLDRDHDGTLDKRELRGRLNAKDFAAADPDNDGTLDKNEFLALVEKRFNAANPDNDGTLDAKELKSSAGRSLARLLK